MSDGSFLNSGHFNYLDLDIASGVVYLAVLTPPIDNLPSWILDADSPVYMCISEFSILFQCCLFAI